ncbi:MAG: hypothetical protein PHI49_10170 [Halothiobacillaceae bacterium]|nr:hypothetical protein [Halothiobacillaceae bacterium]
MNDTWAVSHISRLFVTGVEKRVKKTLPAGGEGLFKTYDLAMNEILWKAKALKQLRRILAEQALAIRGAVIPELVDLGAARHVKASTHHAYAYRLRVGNARVFFWVRR